MYTSFHKVFYDDTVMRKIKLPHPSEPWV